MPEESKYAGDEVLGVTASGTVITEELAEQWATEFENEDFDPTRWETRYAIRFPHAADAPECGAPFPLAASELDALRTRAEEEGRQLKDLIREALNS
jgi:hypothetical protein